MRRTLVLAGVAGLLAFAGPAHAVTVPVGGFGLFGWNKANPADPKETQFVQQSGRSAVQLWASQTSPAAQIRTAALNGTQLSTITELRYATYAFVSSGLNAPYLAFQVDLNGDGAFDDSLVFEPGMQPGGVVAGAWQTWHPLGGRWFSTRGNAGMPMSGPGTLAKYLAAYPAARIVGLSDGLGGTGLIVGDSNNTQSRFGYADHFHVRVGGTPALTFDFGPLT